MQFEATSTKLGPTDIGCVVCLKPLNSVNWVWCQYYKRLECLTCHREEKSWPRWYKWLYTTWFRIFDDTLPDFSKAFQRAKKIIDIL